MKKELTYSNLLDELCKMEFLKFIPCKEIISDYDIYFKNEIIAYYELNDENDLYELVCINKSFYNYINTNYFWNSIFLIWDWSNDTETNVNIQYHKIILDSINLN